MMHRSAHRPLVAVYALFALAAGARGVVQTAVAPGAAPVAHALTLTAALIYLVAAIALHRASAPGRRCARAAMLIELGGVLMIGALTTAAPELLGDDTVWSGFGSGYGWIPLALPLVGLWALRRRREPAGETAGETGRRAPAAARRA